MDNQQTPIVTQAPKKGFGKIIALVVVLVVAIIGGAVTLLLLNSKKAVVYTAIDDMFSMITDNDLGRVLPAAIEQGRITLKVEEGDLLPTEAKMDLWTDMDKNQAICKFSMVGENVTAYATSNDVIVQMSMVEDLYGINLKTALDDAKESPLLPESKELTQTLDKMGDIFGDLTEYSEKAVKARKSMSSLASKYYDFTLDSIYKHSEVSSETKDGVRTVTMVINEETVACVLEDLQKKFSKDKKLASTLEDLMPFEYINYMLDTVSNRGGNPLSDYASWSDLLSEDEWLDDALEAIRDEDFEVTVKIGASSVMHNFVKLELSAEIDGKKIGKVVVDCTDKNTTKIKVTAEGENILSATLKKDGDNRSGSLSLYGKEVGSFDWKYDKKKETFKLKVEVEGDEIVLKGDYKSTRKSLYFKVKTVEYEDEKMELNVSVEIAVGEKLPAFPKSYVNVLTLDKDDLKDIEIELEDWAKEFIETEEYEKLEEFFRNFDFPFTKS